MATRASATRSSVVRPQPRQNAGERGRQRRLFTAVACLAACLVMQGRGASPKFLPDDPLWVDDDRALDASMAAPREDSDYYDFVENTFFARGDRRDIRALNTNTVDEVPDSSWFVNRIGRREMTREELVRGPDRVEQLSIKGWPVVGGKSEGLQAGYRIADPSGRLYQVEFDPPENPEMATGAEMVGTVFYHALGYHVVDVYLVEIDAADIVISEKATMRDPVTRARRRMTRKDIDQVLARVARRPDGKYRALASRFADGSPLGSFRYYGTRPDDPNDVFPHEHRRELRGARVFAAWLNHDDSRSLNSLDMLETVDGKRGVRHYMFDFGSIMGSGTARAQVARAGNEYIFEWTPGFMTLATMGLYLRPWMRVDYPDVPASIGRFESKAFDPAKWRPEYPNVAFDLMRPEDAFWGARIVSRFTREIIEAMVRKGGYTDPEAVQYLTRTLVERREKVLRLWLNQVNPLVDLSLSADGSLTFSNAAVDAGVATAASDYTVQWIGLDNATGTETSIGEPMVATTGPIMAPTGISQREFVGVRLSSRHPQHPQWSRPLTAYFKRQDAAWILVGLER